jgi:hypothetical protein
VNEKMMGLENLLQSNVDALAYVYYLDFEFSVVIGLKLFDGLDLKTVFALNIPYSY